LGTLDRPTAVIGGASATVLSVLTVSIACGTYSWQPDTIRMRASTSSLALDWPTS